MLAEFVVSNRGAIIARVKARVAARTSPRPTAAELEDGIPVFVDQLSDALRHARADQSAPSDGHVQLEATAGRHGSEMFRMGLTVAQVVRDYGDVCQVITSLAVEQTAPIPPGDFRMLNLCLDEAVAAAVTEFSRERDGAHASHETETLGSLAHELRNLLNVAMLAFESIKGGQVTPNGSTGVLLGRSLIGLRDLVDRSLADVRLQAGIDQVAPVSVAELVEEVEISGLVQAEARGVHFAATSVNVAIAVNGDRQILAAALGNLVQNALKFTPKGGHVMLTTTATAETVSFAVRDECGGLPAGKAADLFRPYEQRGADRSGLGLGLTICAKAAKAHGGAVSVHDEPGKGCVFTFSLPRRPAEIRAIGRP